MDDTGIEKEPAPWFDHHRIDLGETVFDIGGIYAQIPEYGMTLFLVPRRGHFVTAGLYTIHQNPRSCFVCVRVVLVGGVDTIVYL